MAESLYRVRVSAKLDIETVDQVYGELQTAVPQMSEHVIFDKRAEWKLRNQISGMLQMVDQAGELVRVVGSIRVPGLDKVFDITLTKVNGVLRLIQDLKTMEVHLTELRGMGTTVNYIFKGFDAGKMKPEVFRIIVSMTEEFTNRFGSDVGQAMMNSLRPYSEELADMISHAISDAELTCETLGAVH